MGGTTVNLDVFFLSRRRTTPSPDFILRRVSTHPPTEFRSARVTRPRYFCVHTFSRPRDSVDPRPPSQVRHLGSMSRSDTSVRVDLGGRGRTSRPSTISVSTNQKDHHCLPSGRGTGGRVGLGFRNFNSGTEYLFFFYNIFNNFVKVCVCVRDGYWRNGFRSITVIRLKMIPVTLVKNT